MNELLTDEKYPYICTPITGETKEIIFEQLEIVITQQPDMIEWRADFFMNVADTSAVLDIITKIKVKTAIPILFTIRAEHEGGEKITLSTPEKIQLFLDVCKQSTVDIVDVETSNNEHDVKEIRRVSKEHGKKLILSYHDFTLTPDNETLITTAQQAEQLGADMAKIAVMPEGKSDVFRLLEVTRIIDKELEIPIITMSMGDIGAISRVIGWTYGSMMTFGVGVESSAPGQIPVAKLREAIQLTQQLVPAWSTE